MLKIKVGDKVKTRLVHHRCELCKDNKILLTPFYKTWRVRAVNSTYIVLWHQKKGGMRWNTDSSMYDSLGRGLGSHLNHQIYKINGRYIRNERND